jgi:hypothetical protein
MNLIREIKAHIKAAERSSADADKHWFAAGRHLMTLRGETDTQSAFEKDVRQKIGIGLSRAYELINIAKGKKNAEADAGRE